MVLNASIERNRIGHDAPVYVPAPILPDDEDEWTGDGDPEQRLAKCGGEGYDHGHSESKPQIQIVEGNRFRELHRKHEPSNCNDERSHHRNSYLRLTPKAP
jgi:hypothetical protein